MRRTCLLVLAFGISSLTVGCNSATQAPKASTPPFAKIALGMPLNDAKALVDGEGEKREHDALPVLPKPRDIYKKLPADTEWRVWTADGAPTLILGIAGGKVAFKQIILTEGGERKSDASALPEYQ